MANEQNLVTGTHETVFHGPDGRLTSARTSRARAFAQVLWDDVDYQTNLTSRIKAGKAEKMELYLARLLNGDPSKAEDDDGELMKHFERQRERLELMLRDHPELARSLAAVVSRSPTKQALSLPAGGNDQIL